MANLLYPITDPSAVEELLIDRGEGIYVYDSKGRRYIEGMAGLWCNSLGHGNLEIAEVAFEQSARLGCSHIFGGRSHSLAMELADKLSEAAFPRGGHVFFGLSGSDANDTLWKILRCYFIATAQPEKRKLIVRRDAYHGSSVASASLTGLQIFHTAFDLPLDGVGALRTASTNFFRDGRAGESELEYTDSLLKNLEQLIESEGPETIAAFMAEPVAGVGGVILPPEGYWEGVQRILNRYGIMLIVDEVITGFGRTGSDFGCSTYGIEPAMCSLAKAMTSGYAPLSAAVIHPSIYEVVANFASKLGVFGHGYTYSGHPVSCAVALKTLEIYGRDQIFQRAGLSGTYLQERLQAKLGEHPLVGEVRGIGLIAGIELVADRASKAPLALPNAPKLIQSIALSHGLIVRVLAGNVIALCPPLIIENGQIDELVESVCKTLTEISSIVEGSKSRFGHRITL